MPLLDLTKLRQRNFPGGIKITYEEAIKSRQIPANTSRVEYDNYMAQQNQQQQQIQSGQPHGLMDTIRDPWGGQAIQTSDVRIIDRWLAVKGMPEIQEHEDTPFFFGPELIEEMEKLALTERSYREINRRISDILALSAGELNSEWAHVESLKLLGRMELTKSRIDIPVKNPNLTVLLNTLRSEQNQTVHYREGGSETKPGILDRVLPWRRR